jgi:hypothetical protein
VPTNGRPLVLLRLKRLTPLGLSRFLVDDRGLGTGVGSLPAGEINADLAPLLLLVRRVRYVNLEFVRSPLFGNATGSAQEILQAEEQLRILEKDVHAATRSPEWPQRGRFSQFQQRVCNVKLLPGRTSLKTKALGQRQLVGSRRAAERRRRGRACAASGGRYRASNAVTDGSDEVAAVFVSAPFARAGRGAAIATETELEGTPPGCERRSP